MLLGTLFLAGRLVRSILALSWACLMRPFIFIMTKTSFTLRAEAPHALAFVTTRLADGRAAAAPAHVQTVLRHLSLKHQQLPARATTERARDEDMFIAVLRHCGDPGSIAQDALAFARAARFVRAEAAVHHARRSYREALDCLLRVGTPAVAAFAYIDSVLNDEEQV